ncbi:UNVERIFIED_CONTAM: hypothetical protein GTU68_026597 [Idotea baltica]|nr:hypothetical protein [Idotea baltica]
MALNIGANDVANNVAPAVGARVISLTGALVLAAICESAGALLGGADVVSTVSSQILSPDDVQHNFTFMQAMLTAMAAAALWINFATLVGAPVSTTHSIVGGVVGAGVAASGFAAINWTTVSTIALTWVASPVLGGMIAAAFMAFINSRVVRKQTVTQENTARAVRQLFAIPLMVTAGLLSFAHGANDVANAVGPLAAIVLSQSIIPLWVSAVGAFGISAGLLLFGRRLVMVVGKKITKLSPVRAFCVTLGAATTVLMASALGMPVSSTHIAVGAVFGVGFYREWHRNRYAGQSPDDCCRVGRHRSGNRIVCRSAVSSAEPDFCPLGDFQSRPVNRGPSIGAVCEVTGGFQGQMCPDRKMVRRDAGRSGLVDTGLLQPGIPRLV